MAQNAECEGRTDPSTRVAELYCELRDELYRRLVANGIRPHLAQELTQATFLRLHASLIDGNNILNSRAWVFTVAHNLALNSRRRPLLLRSERMARIDRAFVTLSRQQRLCLSLRAEGFRYKEIANITGLGISTVGEFLQRAICRLREALHE